MKITIRLHADARKLFSDPRRIAKNLLKRVVLNRSTGCWLLPSWARSGYAIHKVDGVSKTAHRVAYQLAKGCIPEKMEVGHVLSCPHRNCCNPEHLITLTHQQNMSMVPFSHWTQRPETPKHRLSAKQVLAIRASALPVRELASIYGRDPATIRRVRNFTRYAEVTE